MQTLASHHPVFARFVPWSGEVEPTWQMNFLGVRTRAAFTAGMGGEGPRSPQFVETTYPAFDEEYFEWIDALEAVLAANERFTMVELGAGWGRWLINAAAAARQCGVRELCLVGVEAEPTHFHWMGQHFADNGVDPHSHRLIEAAVATTEEPVGFHVGDPSAWYGQAIDRNHASVAGRIRELSRRASAERAVVEVPAVTLPAILGDLEHVDLVDVDIQGFEADVFESAASLLGEKVKRVHIGTHSAEIEQRLRVLFASLRWESLNDYASGTEVDTRWGRISFQDGVQTWRNPRPPRESAIR